MRAGAKAEALLRLDAGVQTSGDVGEVGGRFVH